jgi:hypothetical protein
MINPYILLGLVLAWVASVGVAGYMGDDYGVSRTIAQQKKSEDLVREAGEAAQLAAAVEIAKIKPRNVTIQQEVRREIETNTVYRDCRVPADGVRLANEALTGRAKPAGAGKLPGAVAPVTKP